MENNRKGIVFLIVSFALIATMGTMIGYFEGYHNGSMYVLELVNKADKRERVEIHIIKVGNNEIARDTIVRRGAGGISVVKGKFY
jgi:hypothetical protein